MKLVNDFYDIIATASTDDGLRCKVRLNSDHPLYRVHFPGNPVTPGVCLIQIATEILEQEYHKMLLLSKADSIKFKKTVGSNGQPTFVFTKTVVDSDCLSTRVSIEDEEAQYVKMSLHYHIA
jgi:3-hydroxyacyl-[acyl-carrier-protein] dehydratase